MSFTDSMAATMVNLLKPAQLQAETANTQAQTQVHQADAALKGMQVQTQQRMMDALSQLANGTGPGGGTSATAGQVTAYDDTIEGQNRSLLANAQARQQSLQRVADALRVANPTMSRQYEEEARTYGAQVQQYMDNIRQSHNDTLKQVGGVLTGAVDAPSFTYALARMRADDPKMVDSIPFEKDPGTGAILPTENNLRIAQATGAQFQTAHEIRDISARVARVLATERATDLRDVHAQATEEEASARTAIAREGIGVRQRANDIAASRAGTAASALDLRRTLVERTLRNDSVRVENDAQTKLNVDTSIKNFSMGEQAYNSAKNMMDVMEKSNFEGVRPVEAQTLLTQYRQMVNNYKATMSTAGKFGEQQNAKLSSIFSSVEGTLRSIGDGNKYNPQALRDVSAEISRMYNDMNEVAVKRTLAQRDKVYGRGGNPMAVTSPASLDRAVKAGRASVVVDPATQEKVAVFGDPKNKDNYFPVREQPKPRARLSLPPEEDDEE